MDVEGSPPRSAVVRVVVAEGSLNAPSLAATPPQVVKTAWGSTPSSTASARQKSGNDAACLPYIHKSYDRERRHVIFF